MNWDISADKKLIILDEVHKYKFWRRLIKGYFDKYYPRLNFIATSSVRLDFFRKGGDSLVGRI